MIWQTLKTLVSSLWSKVRMTKINAMKSFWKTSISSGPSIDIANKEVISTHRLVLIDFSGILTTLTSMLTHHSRKVRSFKDPKLNLHLLLLPEEMLQKVSKVVSKEVS